MGPSWGESRRRAPRSTRGPRAVVRSSKDSNATASNVGCVMEAELAAETTAEPEPELGPEPKCRGDKVVGYASVTDSIGKRTTCEGAPRRG